MTSTKRKFIKAGAIIAIICAVFSILTGAAGLLSNNYVTKENMVKLLKANKDYTYVEEADTFYFTFEDEEGNEQVVSEENLETIIKFVKIGVVVCSSLAIAYGIANLVISIVMINKADRNKSSKGLTISLLVLSLLGSNYLTFAFMIVALCLKDLPPANLNNIKDIESEVVSE